MKDCPSLQTKCFRLNSGRSVLINVNKTRKHFFRNIHGARIFPNVSQFPTREILWNINLHRSRLLYGFLDFCNFTTTTEVKKQTRKHYAISAISVPIAKLFCPKLNGSSRSPALERSYGIVFIPDSQLPRFRSQSARSR